ncbi:MAG: hypothetical protein IKV15_06500 [Bacteroidaceae bacterium]|nr:hypothetical protein [Bacteroidaceae bacterium]
MRYQDAENSGLFARIESAKMPKRALDKPKVAIKREQRQLAGSAEQKVKADSKHINDNF